MIFRLLLRMQPAQSIWNDGLLGAQIDLNAVVSISNDSCSLCLLGVDQIEHLDIRCRTDDRDKATVDGKTHRQNRSFWNERDWGGKLLREDGQIR